MTTTLKTCFKCNKTLPLEAFYKHAMMRDGRLNKCKECTKKDANNHRQENLEKIRKYDKARASMPHRMANRSRVVKAYQEKFPDRIKANNAVTNAVRDGRLVKHPCFICGAKKVVGHHCNYSAQLDVVWLCQAHHKQTHAMTKDDS